MKVGDLVRLRPPHPWAGQLGTVVRFGKTIFGERPVVKLSGSGQEVFAMRPDSADVLKPVKRLRARRGQR